MAAKKPVGLNSPIAMEFIEEKTEPVGMPIATALEILKESGLQLKSATFHKTIRSLFDGSPEYTFYSPEGTQKRQRKANMWYTPAGLLIEQAGKYKMIPLANVADTELL